MSDADSGQPVPSPPRPDEAPNFTPPAPPPPRPGDSTQVIAGPVGPGGGGGFPSGGQPASPQDRPAGGVPRPPGPLSGRNGARTLAEQAERLLERPGSSAAWAILLAIAIYWLSGVVGGFAHGSTFRDTFTHTAAYSGLSARQRLDAFLAVGSYDMAFALVLALGLALLVPTRQEREAVSDRRSGAPGGSGRPEAVGPGPLRSDERTSQRLLTVLALAGLVIALAAIIMFISDLSRAGAEPDLSVQGAIEDLAAIPVALVATLWAASRVTERPHWASVAPFSRAERAERRHPAPGGFSAGARRTPGPQPDLADPPPSPPGNEQHSPPN